MAAAGGIAAALFERERTGEGQLVSTSLLRIGMYQLGTDVNTNARAGIPTTPVSVSAAPNPLLTGYRCGDDRWIWLLCLEGDRHWPNLARAIERPDLADDVRFATMEGRRDHAGEVCATLGAIFASRDRDRWAEALDREGVWWARVQHTHELLDDPQAHAAGGFVEVPMADGTTARMVATPVDFGGRSHFATEAVPEHGQHTELVLVELGWDWDRIAAAKAAGAIP
jgi:crotonobetainyl-CoA:carnitine CoA-transferase CaiB-like acyl-CoA transferase